MSEDLRERRDGKLKEPSMEVGRREGQSMLSIVRAAFGEWTQTGARLCASDSRPPRASG